MNLLFNQNTDRLSHYLGLFLDDIAFHLGRRQGTCSTRLLVNSFPKAGTHLLESIFRATAELHCPLHRTIRTADDNRDAKIRAISSGTFRTSHIAYSEDVENLISAEGIRHVLLFRDPRNVIVSHIRYVMEQHTKHPERSFFAACQTKAEQISLLIKGNEAITPLAKRLEGYRKWMQTPNVTVMKFEDIIASLETRNTGYFSAIFENIGLNLGHRQIENILDRASNQKGLTFSGKSPTTWGEHYDRTNRELYISQVLPEAKLLGYPDLPWE